LLGSARKFSTVVGRLNEGQVAFGDRPIDEYADVVRPFRVLSHVGFFSPLAKMDFR